MTQPNTLIRRIKDKVRVKDKDKDKDKDKVALKSLAPQYDEAQHKMYLDRLERAVEDPRNRNIALSGRYGTGKSSVLDEFQKNHKNSTLRLAVSTLAPDTAGESLANRIQKEILKQLIYSARTRTLRHSRFSLRGPLPWWRPFVDSVLFVGVLGALLALLGRLPSQMASGPDHSGLERAVVWALVGALLAVVLSVLRIVAYNRFTVSNVSAAGAALTLSMPNHTYFDEHLDEIVHFFDQEPTDIVIFEDLDRYNNAQIFEALRELNTLLNNTPKRLKKIDKHDKPLRFIYAMRDSLFEKIGKDTAEEDDEARAETVRANRTKFFEIVIPIVPFISHRTAREHLHQLLQEADVTGIERPLVELVAKHATDKRLLLNMCNEYLVFAERLLRSDKIAPELSPSHLFALVAYKNFHLEDFENISRRSSNLDRLYDYHRKLVATSVADREQTKRDLLAENARPPAITPFAKRLGKRLIGIGTAERDRMGYPNWVLSFSVGSATYNSDQVTTPAFWEAVVTTPTIALEATQNPQYGGPSRLTAWNQNHLEDMFPEVLRGRWAERNTQAFHEALQQLDRDIEELRGASFRNLVNTDKFTITEDAGDKTEKLTFAEIVDRTLKSVLARNLVRQGYIDRNFALYAAQFYGDFSGVDVATFIVQTVQTNSMDINYKFTSPGAFANLLAEADEDFTRTISAYNVQLVDHLLIEDVERADEVVKHLTSNFGSEAKQFLTAFFTSNAARTQLAARLSRQPWPDVFTYLILNDGVPADVRTELVDAALVAADPTGAYDLRSVVGDFLVSRYKQMPAFTKPHPRAAGLDTVVAVLRRAKVLLPSLDGIHEVLRTLIVDSNLYELTAGNLRTALDTTGQVPLDSIHDNDTIYQYCLSNLGTYLDAVEADDDTDYSTLTDATLIDALKAAEEDDETLEQLTATASPDSSLPHLTDAPTSTWPALASAKLFRASLANLDAYRAEVGDIDESLGQLLLAGGVIYTDDETDQPHDEEAAATAAVAVLNARRGIPRPEDRVQLVQSLGLEEGLPATQITPEESNLFALLVKHDLVPDDAATFTHLRQGGWAALGPAIVASNKIEKVLTPGLVDGMITDLFEDPETSSKIGPQVLRGLADFLPTDDGKALTAAAKFAIQHNTPLPVEHIRRVATISKDANVTVRLLHITAPTATDIVTVLNELGGKYSYLTTWERSEFEVPNDDAHKAVFKIMDEANQCKARKKPYKDILVVKRP
ncbi:YobI family P-loop NTPase [Rhodococcus sp. UNC363MFTsu5.1]|uniref:YobI family P-loop NTPase n=1 Tax=Rhodococcus sp. UNC363MFTsu5.1 TaxID=1449069 RepID=UPI00048022BA|nr:TniB family NTP-binding protein [Rhodococcus sp. UNC363MFTsu5.1]